MSKIARLKKTLSYTLAACLIFSVTACSSNKTGTTNTNSSANTPSATSTPATPQTGGTLRISAAYGPTTFFLPKSSTTNDKSFTQATLEQLGRVDEKGVMQPWLAESFKDDPVNLTVTIKLRPNVNFSDGSPCNAAAVKWNIEQYMKNGQSAALNNPVSVETTDDLTVVVKYKEFANDWDMVLGQVQISSQQAYEKNGETWCATHMVGTGPFTLESYTQGSKLVFKKNPNYRIKGQPYLDGVEYLIIPDANTQVSAFKNGEIDTLGSKDSVIVTTLESAGFKNIAREAPDLANLGYFMFNTKDKSLPIANLKVRQAILHGIDFKNVAKSLTKGLGTHTNQFGVPGAFSYNNDVKFYEYNVQEAKKLLAEAGYPNGFDTKIFVSNVPGYAPMTVALQASLKDIGINATIITEDSSLMAQKQVKDSIPGIIVNDGASQMDFTLNYTRLYSSKGIKNHGMFDYPQEYEAALFGAREAKTLDEKKKLLQQASKMLTQDYVMVVPFYAIYQRMYTQKNVHDTGIYQTTLTAWTPEAAWISK